MSKRALEDYKYEEIKAAILDPEHSSLSREQQDHLNRVLSIARLLDIQPIQSNAVNLHLAKYTNIKRWQAYEDCRLAMRLFNTIHSFEYDFWQTWLMNDIVRNIEECKGSIDPRDRRVIAAEHANIIKALGERPMKEIDPKLVESHQFIMPIQINNITYQFDLFKFIALDPASRKKVTDALISEITETDVEDIMKS